LTLTRWNYAISGLVFYVAMIVAVRTDPVKDHDGCSVAGGIAVFGLYCMLAWAASDALCVKQLISGVRERILITFFLSTCIVFNHD
jgi:hypothetical protein